MQDELAVLARRQRGVFRRAQAIRAGHSEIEIDRLLRQRVWNRVEHGIYTARPYDATLARSDRQMHLLAAAARLLALGGDVVVSHQSAAIWYEIELLGPWPELPTLTLCRTAELKSVRRHGLAVVPAHHRRGVLTTAARTVVDCARTLEEAAAFVTVESALWLGLDRSAIGAVLDDCRGWPGVEQARRLVAQADEHSETALESRARLWCRDNGLPPAQQQRSVRTVGGLFVAEVDFVWDEYRTVLETDGRKKYAEDDRTGEVERPSGERQNGVLWREKLREDQLRDCGLEVVRGYWSDGEDGGAALAERLRRAFARGERNTGRRDYVLGPPMRAHFRPLGADAAVAAAARRRLTG